MASAPQTPFDVRRQANSPSPVEQAALDHCVEMAEQGQRITQMSIMQAIGSQNTTGGTSAGVLNRLENKGHIKRTFYQRGVQVCIVATGKCTAVPPNTALHHTLREKVPTPTIQAVRQRDISDAEMVERIAKQSGMPIQEVLALAVHDGLERWRLAHDC